jgi:hypothetical protein
MSQIDIAALFLGDEEVLGTKLLEDGSSAVTFARNELLNEAHSPALKNLINDLYRPGARVGDGSTAAAIRDELQTGGRVGGKSHSTKGINYRTALRRLYRSGKLDSMDRAIVRRLLTGLQSAMSGN